LGNDWRRLYRTHTISASNFWLLAFLAMGAFTISIRSANQLIAVINRIDDILYTYTAVHVNAQQHHRAVRMIARRAGSYHNPLERASSSSSGYHVDHVRTNAVQSFCKIVSDQNVCSTASLIAWCLQASELPSAADGGSLDSQIHDMVPGALHAGVNFKRMRERLSPRGDCGAASSL
jgi:hypothetical protein